uniref:Uncharacterized protein n=1 Tax=Plectus sambesii TaxID=2011161 RepID=A0A914UPI9_9BILA
MEESMEILESAHANTRVEPESCSVITLIRDIAKMFSLRSASKSDIYKKWMEFLSLKGKEDAPRIESFLGHRFNILFVLAASIFQVRELILEFCEDYAADNVTLVPIVTRLRDKFIVGQLKVLGLLDKLVTGPLWRLAESDIHILDMGGEYRTLIDWLGANVADPSGFLNGVPPTSPNGWKTVVDSRLSSLIADQDPVVNEHLPIIAKQVLLTCKRYFECTLKDYLVGGKYYEAESGPLRNVTKSVLKTNRIPESVFGLTDYLFRRAPNMTMLTREALVLLLKNKTFAWFDTLSLEEKTTQLKLAKERGPALCSLYLQRKKALTEERKERLRKAKEETVRQRMSAVVVRSNLTNQVAVYGLWTNELEVDMGLAKLSKPSEKLRALEAQLKFRKNVLKQPGDRKLFAFSEKRAKHTWQKLKLNLNTLLVAAYSVAPSSDLLQIVGKRIEHRFEEDGEERWWPGTVTPPVRGTGPGGEITYGIVYDTDVQRVYCCTVGDLTVDIDNGDLLVL